MAFLAASGHLFTGRFDAAGDAAQRSVHINPQFVPAVILLVAGLARAGHPAAARAAAERLLALRPDFHAGEYARVGSGPRPVFDLSAKPRPKLNGEQTYQLLRRRTQVRP